MRAISSIAINVFIYNIILLIQITIGKTITHEVERVDGNTVVDTNVGTILGRRAEDGNYTMFMGIPYADVDSTNPFGLSTPHPRFEEPFEAYTDSVTCAQGTPLFSFGVIDCLQLNVYVPDIASPTNPVPVIVYIHGGAFLYGSAARGLTGPAFIVRHDVIFVSVNYRLGPYGFMCLGTPQVPGNQGLKDQLLGLRWVKENIEYFGGDPNLITIFGQSAGAFSAHLQVLSPHEELYERVILNSGSALLNELINDADIATPVQMARILGLETDDVDASIAFLANQDVGSVLRASFQVEYRFWPCLETNEEIDNRIITDFPINQAVPKIQGKSVLQGITSDEWIMLYANLEPESFADITVIEDFMKIHFAMDDELLETVLNIVKKYYLGGRLQSRETVFNITNYHSDVVFNYPAQRSIPHFLDNGASKVYFYKFSYIGERNFHTMSNNITVGGAAHGDDVGYLFDMDRLPDPPTPEDQLIIDRMTTMWTNFAKYGDPTPTTSTLLPVRWEPIDVSDTVYKYLDIDSEMTMDINPFHERMAFWDLVYEAYRDYERGVKTNFATSLHSSLILLGIVVFRIVLSV